MNKQLKQAVKEINIKATNQCEHCGGRVCQHCYGCSINLPLATGTIYYYCDTCGAKACSGCLKTVFKGSQNCWSCNKTIPPLRKCNIVTIEVTFRDSEDHVGQWK